MRKKTLNLLLNLQKKVIFSLQTPLNIFPFFLIFHMDQIIIIINNIDVSSSGKI